MEKNNSDITHLNSSNYSYVFDDESYRRLTKAAIVIHIIECVLTNITNVALIFILVRSSPRKRPLRNGMLGALIVANLVAGLCVGPLWVNYLVHGRIIFSCVMYWVAADYFLYVENCVQLWTLVLLLLHHWAQLLGWKVPPAWWNSGRLQQYSLRAAGSLCVLLPWLVALFVVVPVVSSWMVFIDSDNTCDYGHLQAHHLLTLLVMTCYLPVTLIVVLGAVLAAVKLMCRKEWSRPTAVLTSQSSQTAEAANTLRLHLTPDDDNDVLDPDPTYVHVLVGLTTVLLLLPGHAFALKGQNYADYDLYLKLTYSFYMVNDLAPIVQALLWLLLLPDLRTRLLQVWAAFVGRLLCKLESPPLSASGATVTFATLTGDD